MPDREARIVDSPKHEIEQRRIGSQRVVWHRNEDDGEWQPGGVLLVPDVLVDRAEDVEVASSERQQTPILHVTPRGCRHRVGMRWRMGRRRDSDRH